MPRTRISFQTRPQFVEWSRVRDFWREADGIPEYDAGWTYDHFVPIGTNRNGPVLEGWSSIAALAAETRRLRLGVLVTGVTFRHPAVLANMAATIDVMSEGRLEIGLGAAWNREEHTAYGLDFPTASERLDRLEETCAVLDALLTRSSANFEGQYYRLREARCEPKPVQSPRPPIVIGGGGEKRTLRIAAKWADHWNYSRPEPEAVRRKIEVLRRHCASVGRDPTEIEISVRIPADDEPTAARRAAELVGLGVHHLVIMFAPPFAPEALPRMIDALRAVGIEPATRQVSEASN